MPISNLPAIVSDGQELSVPPNPAEGLAVLKTVKAHRPYMRRLRKHQGDAMARRQMDDLVDIGCLNEVRATRFANDVGEGERSVIGNRIDPLGITSAEDMGDKVKRMVMRIPLVGEGEFVERGFEREPVDVVLDEFAGAPFGMDGEFHFGDLCKYTRGALPE